VLEAQLHPVATLSALVGLGAMMLPRRRRRR